MAPAGTTTAGRRLAPRARTAGWLRMAPRRSSRAALWCQRLAIFAVPYLVFVVLGHRFGQIETTAAYWLLGLGAMVLLAALACGLLGFRDLWVHGHRGGMRALRGVILASILLLPFAYSAYLAFALPPLNDVTTDLSDPPEFSAALNDRADDMNPIAAPDPARREAQLASYPALAARSYSGDIDRVFKTVFALVTERDWEVLAEAAEIGEAPIDIEGSGLTARPQVLADGTLARIPVPKARPDPNAPAALGPIAGERLGAGRDEQPVDGDLSRTRAVLDGDERYIEALATSAVFGFATDVVVRLVEEDDRTVVDMRAASRYGRHDLGANAALIEDFLRDLDDALQGLAGE